MAEEWVIVVRLPADVQNGGRFMARVLKYLLRTWGVRCCALRERPPAALCPPARCRHGQGRAGDADAEGGIIGWPENSGGDVKPVGFSFVADGVRGQKNPAAAVPGGV